MKIRGKIRQRDGSTLIICTADGSVYKGVVEKDANIYRDGVEVSFVPCFHDLKMNEALNICVLSI